MNVRFEGNNGQDADVTRWLLMTLADVRELQNAFGILKSAPKGCAKCRFGGTSRNLVPSNAQVLRNLEAEACSDLSLSPSLRK